jgi:hypothetical protein
MGSTRQSNLVSDGRLDGLPIIGNSDRLEAIWTRIPRSKLLNIQSHDLSFIMNKSTGGDQRHTPYRYDDSQLHKHP